MKRNQDTDLTIEYFQEQATYVRVGGVLDSVLSRLPQSRSPESEACGLSKRFWTRLKPDFYARLLRKIVSSFHRGLSWNDHKSLCYLNGETQHAASLPERN